MKQAILIGLFVCLLFGSTGFFSPTSVRAQGAASLNLQAPATATPAGAGSPTPQPTTRASTYERPLVNLVANSYDPGKTYAGNKFTLSAKLKNQGQKTAYNIAVTFSGSDVQPQTNGGVIIIPSLAPDEAATIDQDLLIKSSVSTYQTNIDEAVEYKDENGSSFSQKFVAAINVYWFTKGTSTPTITPTPAGRPRLVISSYTLDNPNLQPGSSFKLSLKIQNLGTNAAHNVFLTITSGTGASANTNFLPVGSSNAKVLGDLPAGQGVDLQQAFIVNSTTTPGAYPVTLSMAYRDDSGNNLTDEQLISLLVYLVPAVEVGFYEAPGAFTVGQKTNLPIQVVNLASSSVLLGTITIAMESASLANNQLFIGTLDGGGTFTMDTDLTPQKGGEQTIRVTINYLDNFKAPQTITRSLPVTVTGGGTAGGPGGQQPGSSGPQATLSPQAATQIASRTGQQQAGGDWWQLFLRFVRGMIGFDSAATPSGAGYHPDGGTGSPAFIQAPSGSSSPTPGR